MSTGVLYKGQVVAFKGRRKEGWPLFIKVISLRKLKDGRVRVNGKWPADEFRPLTATEKGYVMGFAPPQETDLWRIVRLEPTQYSIEVTQEEACAANRLLDEYEGYQRPIPLEQLKALALVAMPVRNRYELTGRKVEKMEGNVARGKKLV